MEISTDVVLGQDTSGELALRILTFIFLMAISLLVQKIIRNHLKVSKSQYFTIAISVNMILSLTLAWWRTQSTSTAILSDANSLGTILDLNPSWIFNFLLYIPAAFFLNKYLKKSLPVILFLVFLSFSIETIQRVFEWGSSDPADWIANSVGVVIGVLFSLIKGNGNPNAKK